MESAGNDSPLVSVILPVRNEEQYLGEVLDQLSRQTLPREKLEVLVVDGMSSDDTLTVAERYRHQFHCFLIIENPNLLASAARNLGLQAADGQYIVFIDGHCQLASDSLLEDMIRLFEREKVDVLCRPQPLTAEPMSEFQRAVAVARASWLGHGTDSTIYTDREATVPAASSGAMYRRSVFDRVGTFDEDFDAAEDVEFNTRVDLAGLKAFNSPLLTVKYAARKDLLELWRQLLRYGLGRWQLLVKHPTTMSLGTLIPPALAIGLVLLLFWWLVFSPLGWVLTVVYLLYLLLVIGVSLTVAAREGIGLLPMLPLIYLTIHLALGVGFLTGPFRMKGP